MNLCKDCKHFRPQVRVVCGRFVDEGVNACAACIEPVYGSQQDCRIARTQSGECGKGGVLWELRPVGEENATLTFWVSETRDGAGNMAVTKDAA